MAEQPRVLILGTSRNLGRQLFARLGPQMVLATYCTNPILGAVHFDALTTDLGPILDRFPTIEHAAILYGETDPDRCFADPEGSKALNVDSIKRNVDVLQSRSIHIIFISSQFVFNGIKGDYIEDDPVNPVLLYGKQKVEIEEYLKGSADNYVTLRLSKAVGDQPHDGSLFSYWIDSILAGRKMIKCAADQKLSPIFVEDVVEGVIKAMENRLQGTYHLCGIRGYRRIELLSLLSDSLKQYVQVDVEVVPCSIHDFGLPERRPVNVSMRPDKLIASTGISISDMDTVCRRTVQRYFSQSLREDR